MSRAGKTKPSARPRRAKTLDPSGNRVKSRKPDVANPKGRKRRFVLNPERDAVRLAKAEPRPVVDAVSPTLSLYTEEQLALIREGVMPDGLFLARTQCRAQSRTRKAQAILACIEQLGLKLPPTNPDERITLGRAWGIAREAGVEAQVREVVDSPEVYEQVRCTLEAIPGGSVCFRHGGTRQAVIANAQQKMMTLVDPALAGLLKVVRFSKNPNAIVAAANSILDRTGLKLPQEIKVERTADVSDLAKLDNDELEILIKLHRKMQSEAAGESLGEGTGILELEAVDVT